MDIQTRRTLLDTAENPEPQLDYVVSLTGSFGAGLAGGMCTLTLRYVPDHMILDRQKFHLYLEQMDQLSWDGLEHAAADLLNDLSNELVARWTQLHIGNDKTAVLLEDRQPNWSNDSLLARLKPL